MSLDLKACSGACQEGSPLIALWWQEGMIASSDGFPLPGMALVGRIEAHRALCAINAVLLSLFLIRFDHSLFFSGLRKARNFLPNNAL